MAAMASSTEALLPTVTTLEPMSSATANGEFKENNNLFFNNCLPLATSAGEMEMVNLFHSFKVKWTKSSMLPTLESWAIKSETVSTVPLVGKANGVFWKAVACKCSKTLPAWLVSSKASNCLAVISLCFKTYSAFNSAWATLEFNNSMACGKEPFKPWVKKEVYSLATLEPNFKPALLNSAWLELTMTWFNKPETPLLYGFSEVEPAPTHKPKVADLASGLDSVAMVIPLDKEVYWVLP
ncbi:hypothetical protein WICPIJ_001452 [Wickerhamomyces pijperi]|uniref:Uncharacterized protein n=1 Tax=Wickerhamomyces pijperi TaxID=599730 RepID=A0A9P8QAS5_WICPI|nr:hypothetical protein WICPIJ_001452 [Wickerhamomyces pijperi]